MIELSAADYARMRAIARKKAWKVARQHDDIEQAAQDIEQDGWETFCRTYRVRGPDVEFCWMRAKSRMAEKYYQFRCGSRCWVKHIPLQGLDLTPLASLDPSVEELVYGCELMRRFEADFGRRRKDDKCAQEFEAMICQGLPYGSYGQGRRGSARGDQSRRRQRIKELYRRLAN